MDFHWSLIDSKSPHVSRTLLNNLTVPNSAVVWIVSSRPPTAKSSSSFKNPLVTVIKALITTDIIVTFMFSFSTPYQVIYPSFHILPVLICGQPGQLSPQFGKFSFLLLIMIKYVLAEIRWSVCMSNPKGVYMCHSLGQVLGVAYTIYSYCQI